MNILIHAIAALLIIVSYMLGGQFGSAWRKYGIMVVLTGLEAWKCLHGGIWWHYLPLAILSADLFTGYGDKSIEKKIFKIDWLIRLAFAVSLLLGILGVDIIEKSPWWVYSAQITVLVGAFQLHLGAFKIGEKDFLWEDFARSSGLVVALFFIV